MGRRLSHNRAKSYPTLKAWRDDQHWTSEEASAYLRMSRPKYSKLENGRRYLTGPEAASVMAKTGVPLAVLVGAA